MKSAAARLQSLAEPRAEASAEPKAGDTLSKTFAPEPRTCWRAPWPGWSCRAWRPKSVKDAESSSQAQEAKLRAEETQTLSLRPRRRSVSRLAAVARLWVDERSLASDLGYSLSSEPTKAVWADLSADHSSLHHPSHASLPAAGPVHKSESISPSSQSSHTYTLIDRLVDQIHIKAGGSARLKTRVIQMTNP